MMEPTFLVLGLAANGPHPTHIDGSMLLAGIDPTTHLPRLVELGDNGTLGASSLSELTDVNITSPEDGHYLAYDAASGKWIDSAGLPGSGTVTSVGVIGSGLVNVVSGSPVTTSGNITIGLTASDNSKFARGDGTWANSLNGALTLGSTATPIGTLSIPIAPTNSTNFGLINIGAGPFDGSGGGFNSGNSNSTILAMNAASGYTGRLVDLQIAGVALARIGMTTIASGALSVLNTIDFPGPTVTITGVTGISNAAGFNYLHVGQPTYSGTVTVTNAATVVIDGAPVASGTTITNAYAMWIKAGTSRFDGAVVLNSGGYDGFYSVPSSNARFSYVTGFGSTTSIIGFIPSGAAKGLTFISDAIIGWATNVDSGTKDLTAARLGAANLRLGAAPSATPIANTLTIGESSRPGTDTNIAGANGTIQSGLGTGTGTGSSLIFQTPTVVGSGTGVQTYATRLTLTSGIATFVGTIQMSGNTLQMNGASTALFAGVTYLGVANDFSGIGVQGSASVVLRAPTASTLVLGLVNSATPVAQTFVIGEASRPGTDSNIAGANGTIQSGLGTGTGTGSSLIFQTPTVVGSGTGVQTYATRLTLNASGLTIPSSSSITNGGIALQFQSTAWTLASNIGSWNGDTSLTVSGLFGLTNGSVTGAAQVYLASLGTANIRQGAAPSASPVAQIFTIGEASRPGTDSNVGGANGTIQSGLGTGTGTASSLIFQTPTVAGSGTGVQTQATRLTLDSTGLIVTTANAASGIQFVGSSQTGRMFGNAFGDQVTVSVAGSNIATFSGGNFTVLNNGQITLGALGFIQWSTDTFLTRLATASLKIGGGNSATPVAQTLTIGEASRSGTDSNVGGASGTLRPGTGTGTGTPAPLIFTAPITVASGTGAQTQTEGLRVQGVGTAIGLGFYGHAAAARASAYTPTNVSTDRSYDANASSIDELADVLGTLIADLQSYGLLG